MSVYWTDGTELYHYGIKGQRWGERRYQNEDGTYTEEGRRRYGIGDGRTYKKLNRTKASSGNPVSRSRKGIDINKVKNAAVVVAGAAGLAAMAYAINNNHELREKVNGLLFDRDVQVNAFNEDYVKANAKLKEATQISIDHLAAKYELSDEQLDADQKKNYRLRLESQRHYKHSLDHLRVIDNINKDLDKMGSKSRSTARKISRYTTQYYKKNYNEEDRKKYM